MQETAKIKKELINDIGNREYSANVHVMKCFSIAMLVYSITFLLNVFDIFIIDKAIMIAGFIPSIIIYSVMLIITKCVSLSNKKMKYVILFSTIWVFTLIGVTVTYHAVVVSLLPLSYAILYSSKRVMRYVYGLTVLSTGIVVYAGYYFGLCDANMALLTTTKLENYVVDGVFTLVTPNENPAVTLLLFFVIPRCLIQYAFIAVYNSIFRIVEESLQKAADVVQKEKLEIQRAEMEREKADAANKAKSTFLSSMSHEIRTPMNAIVGMTEVLLRGKHSEETIEYLNNIKVSGDALLTIINGILDFSKIESGKMDIIEDEYEPRLLYNDLHMLFVNRIGDKPVELLYDIDANLPCRLYGDVQRIRQIVINLMNNAIKFTDEGFVKLTVKSNPISENVLEISCYVEDSGQGIKPEDMNKLFDTYQQVDKEKNHYKEGTGLGLSISKQLVELMGGTIGVTSEYGKGSTFYFTIPQEIRYKGMETEGNKNVVANEKDLLSFVAPKAKILVVDDNTMNIKVAKALLKPLQTNIDTAENGRQAIEKIKNKEYNLVFMDHMMPVMDGIEAVKVIREMEDPYYRKLPVVALSANATVEARELFKENGFSDFVAKPIKFNELCGCIRRWLPKEYVVIESSEETVGEEMVQNDIQDIPGINIEEGIENSGSKDLFLSLLADFYKLIDQKSVKVEKCLADGLLREYTIEVHALKSTARMIGAMELSDKFYELEKLGDVENQIAMEKLTPDVISLYRSFKPLLEPFAKSMEQKKKEVSTEEIIETLNQLRNAMDCFELDEADRAMHKLEGYMFPEDCRLKVEQLSAFVADVAMEDVMELTECLIQQIQK